MNENIHILTTLMGLYVNTQDSSVRLILKNNIEKIYKLVMGEFSHGELTPAEIECGMCHGKIPCIKMVRSRTGLGLQEARALVEKIFQAKNICFNEVQLMDR